MSYLVSRERRSLDSIPLEMPTRGTFTLDVDFCVGEIVFFSR
jgi:hypothetical protein